MLQALMVAYLFPFSLIAAPFFIIILAAALILGTKYPSHKRDLGVVLFVAGLSELGFSFFFFFVWGELLGLATAIIGFFTATLSYRVTSIEIKRLNQKTQKLKKAAYLLLALTILVSATLIFARATNLIREQQLAVFEGDSIPNLTVKGIVNSFELNHEVSNGFSYRIFPAYLTVDVSEVVSSGYLWGNQTITAEYLQHQGKIVVYFENADIPSLAIGQQVEIKGYYTAWLEDSLYSYSLTVSPAVNGSYLKVT